MDRLKSSWAFSCCTMSSGLSGSMSGHRMLLVELGALPLAGGQHLPEMFDRLPYVFETDVQRREAEAQDVRVPSAIAGAIVADDAPRDERLHDGIGTLRS